MESIEIMKLWEEIKQLTKELELDAYKNSGKGVFSAGVRLRKGLRDLKKKADQVIKKSLANDKENKANRPKSEKRLTGFAKKKTS